jgi:nucleoside-diphosphate-sugar epimerase
MMRIFIAGATGAVGQPLVRRLVAEGHEVSGMTRSPQKTALLSELGAEPVLADALDRDAVIAAVRAAQPEVVVHQLTAIGAMNLRKVDASFAATNRLRTEGTDNLLAAAQAAGARLFVAQSYAGWPYAREGGPAKAEDAPLDPDPPKGIRETHAAIRHLENAVTGAAGLQGIVLRYGGFYGPGTGLARGGDMLENVVKGRVPVIGDGGGVWSLVHIEDAAEATVAAIDRGEARMPGFLGRLLLGPAGYSMMTKIRGASNAKAKRELGWTPRHASWRQGFESL